MEGFTTPVISTSSNSEVAPSSVATTPPSEGSFHLIDVSSHQCLSRLIWRLLNPKQTPKDVAIIGMACRLAGGNDSPEQLWQAMLEKKNFSGEMPSMRWEPYYKRDVRNTKELKQTTSKGYFLNNLENFDAAFFGISPKEAEQMDPQQRLSLEVCWEALENAGIPPQSLSKSDTAVFMGVNSDDYSKLLLEDLPGVEAWMGIGTAYCGVPNRISYHLDLMGPSTAVDAACASSLVAIHHGRQAIIQGESKIAIAGGVNALCGPGLTRVLDKAGAVSPEGSCMSFDDDAHGYGRGEGAAIVVLKEMTEAVADGDNIIAVLKGSAVAQDGRTNGIMAPNAKAQELVAYKALKTSNIDPSEIQYVEAHATSTPLGDPTEVSAIANVYGSGRSPEKPVFIGSVKPNVGHLEAGAGAVGFIKAAMAMKKGVLPPQASLKKLNSKIDWEKAGVKVVQETTEWPDSHPNSERFAAICSYGYGGTVSHAVIKSYSEHRPIAENNDSFSFPNVLLLSAPQEKRVAIQASKQASWLSSGGKDYDLHSIATTLATRRGHHDYRSAVIVNNHEEAIQSLQSLNNASTSDVVITDRVLDSGVDRGVVWVFSGHGAQWKEMGRDLLRIPTFYNAVAALDFISKSEMGFAATEALKEGDFDSSDRVQVLTYMMQIGLIALFRSKGLRPSAIIGHSVGEIAASVASRALTAEEGAWIVCKRANLYRRVAGQGAMILVNSPFVDISSELKDRADVVAAIDSSPSSCVISGEAAAVQQFDEELQARGIKTFRVKTDIAFHSPLLEQIADPLSSSLRDSLNPQSPRTKLYSTSNPDPRSEDIRDAGYWVNNTVNPVLLRSAVNAAAEDGYRLFLEVSSHPIVAHSVSETLMAQGIEDFGVFGSMDRKKPAATSIMLALAQLHCKGAHVSWTDQMGKHWCPDVPLTTWVHKPVWKQVQTGPLGASETHDVEKHNLLGHATNVAGTEISVYATKLDNNNKPFPGSHPLHGTEIVPAAVLVNTFLNATKSKTLSDIVLRVPVAVNAPRDVQVVVEQDRVKLASTLIQQKDEKTGDKSWMTHTTGRFNLTAPTQTEAPQNYDIDAITTRIGSKLADNFSIDYLDKVGVSAMGFPWAVTEHYGNLKEMIAKVDVAPSAENELPWNLHSWAPMLDAATSVGSTIFFDQPRLRMPAQIDRVEVYTDEPPPKVGYLYVEPSANADLAVDVCVLGEEGAPLFKFIAMRFSEIEGTPGSSGSSESLVHQMSWPPATFSEKPLPISHIVLISEHKPTLDEYVQYLSSKSISTSSISRAGDLSESTISSLLSNKDTAVVYAPGSVASLVEVPQITEQFISELLHIVKFVTQASSPSKVFAIVDKTFGAENPTALAQAALHGLSRIIASELPDLWGGLIDNEDSTFPLQVIKYVQGQDVIRVKDLVPRVARLRPLPRERLAENSARRTLLPRPEGTYIITGGLGALGLEVADFLVEKGARRLVLISRRRLPSRREWDQQINASTKAAIQKIKTLEKQGATIHAVAVDIGSSNGSSKLQAAIDALSLPPISGVIHAAGVLEDQLVLETTRDSFSRVLNPKITGALALHELFPPQILDFFILFSSCGQLFGFPGQSSYASGNAFLDTLATYRRNLGDNAVAFQWTSWRGMGMAASTDFINAELESKGITDVTRDEAFRAWEHLDKYDIDHGVVLRSRAFDEGEALPVPILTDIAIRRAGTAAAAVTGPDSTNSSSGGSGSGADVLPTSGPELKQALDTKIRECVMSVLQLSSIDDVDPRVALSDLGVDSVMTVTLRKQLQAKLKVKVPPTLTWSHPTVGHLVGWYVEKLSSS